MKVIAISGVIGWDISARDIRSQLEAAAGEDIEVQISSPGGIIFDGLEIFNLIRNYPGAKTTRLMGLAGSMASYVALSADRVIQEENAIFMIHNAEGVSIGDYQGMQKMAEILDGFSGVLARAYARKSGKSIEDIRSFMDEETWYFGEEAKEAGFVDEIVPAPEDAEKDKEALMAIAKAQVAQCRKIIGEVESQESLMQVAANVEGLLQKAEKKSGVAGTKPAARAATQEEQRMTLDQLKTEHPDVYRAVMAAGEAAGVRQERERQDGLRKWDDPACAEIVGEAIAAGKTEGDVMPQLMRAMSAARTETPDQVAAGAAGNGAGAAGNGAASEEDIKKIVAGIPKA